MFSQFLIIFYWGPSQCSKKKKEIWRRHSEMEELEHLLWENVVIWKDSRDKLFFKNILFIYFYREGKGGRERGRETLMCERNINQLPLTRARHVPWLGIKPATFHFVRRPPSNWATPVRAIDQNGFHWLCQGSSIVGSISRQDTYKKQPMNA